MKRLVTALMMILLSCSSIAAEEYDISGLWYIKGTGFAEKSFVRISMELIGDMTLTTSKVSELSGDIINVLSEDAETLISRDNLDEKLNALTGYEINLKINAMTNAGFDIRAWSDHLPNYIRIPIIFPELRPTLSKPFTLPAVSKDGLSYQVTFTSTTSGKVRIRGYVDFDVVGSTEINSDCEIWKSGTPEPGTDEETKSGCNSGIGILAAILSLGVCMIVRH